MTTRPPPSTLAPVTRLLQGGHPLAARQARRLVAMAIEIASKRSDGSVFVKTARGALQRLYLGSGDERTVQGTLRYLSSKTVMQAIKGLPSDLAVEIERALNKTVEMTGFGRPPAKQESPQEEQAPSESAPLTATPPKDLGRFTRFQTYKDLHWPVPEPRPAHLQSSEPFRVPKRGPGIFSFLRKTFQQAFAKPATEQR